MRMVLDRSHRLFHALAIVILMLIKIAESPRSCLVFSGVKLMTAPLEQRFFLSDDRTLLGD